ncbi:MAG: hypothetical protein EAX96_08460 [Candidatus Lokiarchaeota archaeon]|nr:hypothetical protein [Candidatus Lokiarchaeota archaeon]
MKDVEELKNQFKIVITGNYERKTLTHIITPLLIIIFFGSMAVSWIIYPNYNWTIMNISYLGSPYRNPFGWIFFSIGMTITGFTFIIIVPYVHRRLVSIHKIAFIGTFFFYIAIIGIIGVGAIPQLNLEIFKLIHFINAILALGGFYLCLGFYGICLLLEKKIRNDKLLIPFTILGWFAPIGTIITQVIRFSLSIPDNSILILNFSVWEWLLLYCIFVDLILLIFILREE